MGKRAAAAGGPTAELSPYDIELGVDLMGLRRAGVHPSGAESRSAFPNFLASTCPVAVVDGRRPTVLSSLLASTLFTARVTCSTSCIDSISRMLQVIILRGASRKVSFFGPTTRVILNLPDVPIPPVT